MRKRSMWLALVVILLLVLSGCGAAVKQAAQMGGAGNGRSASGAAPTAPAAETPAPGPAGAPSGESGVTVWDAAGNVVGGAAVPAVDRKIIQNAEVELSVKDVDEAMTAINDALVKAGGYVQENRMSGTREQGRRVTMKLRVPASQYGSLIDMLRGLGEVRSLNQWTNDVSEEYLDLEARIETGEAHLAQLNKLYERSGTVTEMIELEREIARVTADLESLKGRYSFLSNQVAFSTITINLYEPGVPIPSRDPQSLGERMRDSFLFSWNETIDAAQYLLVWLVAMVPRLIFVAAVGAVLGVLAWLVMRSRRGRRRPPGGGAGSSKPAGDGGHGTPGGAQQASPDGDAGTPGAP